MHVHVPLNVKVAFSRYNLGVVLRWWRQKRAIIPLREVW